MFRVYFVHVRSSAPAEFGNFDAALNHAQRRGFEAVLVAPARAQTTGMSSYGSTTCTSPEATATCTRYGNSVTCF